MGALHDVNASTVILELKRRGLGADQIDRTMQKMVGRDWKEIPVMSWRTRLRQNGLEAHADGKRFIEELEALVIGTILLEEPDETDRTWGRA